MEVLAADSLPLGRVVPRVTCVSDTTQSYALYLPTSYKPALKFPVIFIFEPLARGPLPVRIMQEAAEKYGYILAASNNSRNGPVAESLKAANAMYQDVTGRFSVDPKRVYFAGFSGGARLAINVAAGCHGCAAGIAACGAGYPQNLTPMQFHSTPLFVAIGDEDFNFPEIIRLEPILAEAKSTYHVLRFSRAHEWPPSEVWLEVLAWFQLQAMKSGTIPKDDRFIADGYQAQLSAASEFVSKHDHYAALRAYRQAVADYEALLDTGEAQRFAAELEKSKLVKDAIKGEQRELDEQADMEAPIYQHIQLLITGQGQTPDNARDLEELVQQLRRRTEEKDEPRRRVAKRALSGIYIHIYEAGGALIEKKQFSDAIILYGLITSTATKAPGAHLQRARAYAGLKDKKRAMNELRAAIQDGLRSRSDLDQPEFALFKASPDFNQLVDSIPQSGSE